MTCEVVQIVRLYESRGQIAYILLKSSYTSNGFLLAMIATKILMMYDDNYGDNVDPNLGMCMTHNLCCALSRYIFFLVYKCESESFVLRTQIVLNQV